MIGLLCFVLAALASPFKSKMRLEAENVVLRHQLIVLRRRLRGRVRLTNNDRWFFIQLYRWFPSILQVLTIIRPETLLRWHRAGFRCYWRWKSRPQGGRPQIDTELRVLIRRMSVENPLWGAPRIHGELLKLGFEIAQSSVAKCMVKQRGPPSQGWRTFLRNHAPDIAAMDLFVVPTIGFDLLYAFVSVRLHRRDLVWINVTANPTAEWVARQIMEAFPWDGAPRYMIRDRDRNYGAIVTRRLRAMGIRDKPVAPASPWQNGVVERLIGSIRRECLDHVIIRSEAHLRRILKSYASVTEQRCAGLPPASADWNHSFTPDTRRASPLLRPGLSFRYTQVFKRRRQPHRSFETAPDTIAVSRRACERTRAAGCVPCRSRIVLRQSGREGRYPRFDAGPRRGGSARHIRAVSREAHRRTSGENSARSSRPGLRKPWRRGLRRGEPAPIPALYGLREPS